MKYTLASSGHNGSLVAAAVGFLRSEACALNPKPVILLHYYEKFIQQGILGTSYHLAEALEYL